MKFFNQDDKQVLTLSEARYMIFSNAELTKCEEEIRDYLAACDSKGKEDIRKELGDLLEDPLLIPDYYYPVYLISDTVKSLLLKFAEAPIDPALYPKCPKCNTNTDVVLEIARSSHTHACSSRYHNDFVLSFTPNPKK